MWKIVIVFSFLSSIGCRATGLETQMSRVYELAKNNIKFDIFTDQIFEDSLMVGGFDFFSLKPNNEKINPKNYYKVYTQKGLIKKISRYNTINRLANYDVFLFPAEGFLFYTIYMFKDHTHNKKDGFFVRGFFFRMDYNQLNFFVGLNDVLLPVIEHVDEHGNKHQINEGYLFHFPEESTVKDINKIMNLNGELESEIRLNYYEGELLSNSRIRYKGNKVYEVLELLPKTSCSLETGLEKATLSILFDVIDRNGCHSHIQALVKPDYPDGRKRPIWAYHDRYYIYKDLECFDEQ